VLKVDLGSLEPLFQALIVVRVRLVAKYVINDLHACLPILDWQR
jgi:hypothetical protein